MAKMIWWCRGEGGSHFRMVSTCNSIITLNFLEQDVNFNSPTMGAAKFGGQRDTASLSIPGQSSCHKRGGEESCEKQIEHNLFSCNGL